MIRGGPRATNQGHSHPDAFLSTHNLIPTMHTRLHYSVLMLIPALVGTPGLAAIAPASPDELKVHVGGFLGANTTVSLHDAVVTCATATHGKQSQTISARPTASAWAEFRSALDSLDAWHWRTSYVNPAARDGTQWQVAITYPNQQLVSSGSNSYPGEEASSAGSAEHTPTFRKFRAAVAELVPGCVL